mgnify:CR=1 FL=1
MAIAPNPPSHPGAEALRTVAHPLQGDAADLDRILRRVGTARFVLIGEASHGTHQFYRVRSEITKRLINGLDL